MKPGLGMVAVAAGLLVACATSAQMESGAQERPGFNNPDRQIFMKNGCHGCHTVDKFGTPIGPDLSKVGAKYSTDYFERWLRDPASQRPRAHMQALELTEADLRALARYLSGLR